MNNHEKCTTASRSWPRTRMSSWNGRKGLDPMNTGKVTVGQRGGFDVDDVEAAGESSAGAMPHTHTPVDRTGAGRQRAESLDRTIGSLVHAVSNSLNSVMVASQLANLLIAQGRLREARISLDRAEEECSRAARLLRDGCNLATLKVPDAPGGGSDVATLLAACTQACAGLGEVSVACDTTLPQVRGQADALTRLFFEIMGNAFQFGARTVSVSAQADHERGVARIEFSNDGPGVSVDPGRLFDPYVTTEPAEHSGVGLAFAARIAAAYGGTIDLGEPGGDGVMFRVTLPFAARCSGDALREDPSQARNPNGGVQ